MIYSLYIPIISLIFISVIAIFYFAKKRLNSVENKIYGYMLIANVVGLAIEILCYFAVRDAFMNITLDMFILKTYLIYLLTWQILMTLYVYSITRKKIIKNFFNKENMFFVILIGFYIASSICLYIFDLNIFYEDGIAYTYGLGTQFLYGLFSIIITSWIIMLIKNRKIVTKYKLLPIFSFFVIGSIATVIQLMNPWMILITSAESLVLLLMYHTIENPDMKMVNSLALANDQALKANEAKNDFLSSMSHEAKTPINAISNLSDFLLDTTDKSEIDEYAKDIKSASNSLSDMIDGMLMISAFDTGKNRVIATDYNLMEVVNEIIKGINFRLQSKKFDFSVNVAKDLPMILNGDKENVRTIIIQLLTNAIKYTDLGQIELNIVGIKQGDKFNLVISVTDTGRGIKAEEMPYIFDKWSRSKEDMNTTRSGQGLGLAIVKHLTELMNGEISPYSVYGKGSKFLIKIPQKIINPNPNTTPLRDYFKYSESLSNVEEIISDTSKPILSNLSGTKVLVVDDSLINRSLAKRILNEYNIEVDLLEGGQQCIENIKNGNIYNFIFMDIMMPDLNGMETLSKLREIENFNIPVIAFTADTTETAQQKYKSVGFNGYIPKGDSLREEISKFISNI